MHGGRSSHEDGNALLQWRVSASVIQRAWQWKALALFMSSALHHMRRRQRWCHGRRETPLHAPSRRVFPHAEAWFRRAADSLPVVAGGCAVVAPCGIFLVLSVLIISTLQAKAKIQRNMAVLLGNRRDDAPKCNASRKQNPAYTNETATRLEAQEDATPDNLYRRPARFEQQGKHRASAAVSYTSTARTLKLVLGVGARLKQHFHAHQAEAWHTPREAAARRGPGGGQ
jgi:hypothetical protein